MTSHTTKLSPSQRSKTIVFATILLCAVHWWLPGWASAEETPQTESASFSFNELWAAPPLQAADVQSLEASDGIRLAYRAYLPAEAPKAIMVFYHGAGLHSGAGYQYIGHQLSEKYGVAVFMPDLRGHGESEGPRGDSPTSTQVWQDVSTMLYSVRKQFKGLPVFLGGHSAGSALILNYASNVIDDGIEGLALIAPSFGPEAGTERKTKNQFARPNTAVFIAHALTGGTLFGHSRALELNYPPAILAKDPKLVSAYTANMAWAIVPRYPGDLRPANAEGIKQQLSGLKSFGLWVGTDDEVFDANRVTAIADEAGQPDWKKVEQIPATNHMSILINIGNAIGPWLLERITEAKKARKAIVLN